MNNEHLNDFIERADKLNLPVGDIISDYTRLAINYAIDPMKPQEEDYNLAYDTIKEMEKYKV